MLFNYQLNVACNLEGHSMPAHPVSVPCTVAPYTQNLGQSFQGFITLLYCQTAFKVGRYDILKVSDVYSAVPCT